MNESTATVSSRIPPPLSLELKRAIRRLAKKANKRPRKLARKK